MTVVTWRTRGATAITLTTLGLTTLGLTVLGPASTAQAQVQAQVAWCGNRAHTFPLDMQIGGCTTLIESGKMADKPLAWSHTNRGIAYAAKGDFDRALVDYDVAIKLDPSYALAYINRGTAYDNKGDHDHAIADFGEAIKLEPKSADAWTGRCAAQAETGRDLEQALADCNQSLQFHGKDAGTLNSRGFVYLRLGQFDSAIGDYNAALKENPKLGSALYGRGLAKQKKGDAAGGQLDMAAAILTQSDIAAEFAGYGVK